MKLLLPKKLLKFLFVAMLFVGYVASGQVSITTTTPITQNFNTLSSTSSATWTNNTTPLAGWYSTVTTLNINNGSTISNNVYNCGTTSATDRSLGALSTSTTHNFGIRLKNNNANAITSLLVAFNGEQWRQNTVSQTLVFEYQIGTTVTSITSGSWTAVTALDFVAPQVGTAGALDGNLAANRIAKSSAITLSVPAGSEIMLRWTKSGSNSSLLAVDDLSITPTFTTSIVTPTLTTTTATSITTTTASSGGNVTADGGATVSAKGVAFGTTSNPSASISDGTGTGTFSSSLTGLLANTQYFYRAFATNSAGTAYGSENNFYTLANVPGVLTVANSLQTTIDVAVSTTTQNSNPATTEYAIQETGGQYVQANGTLGATPVWQTAAVWATKTVTGLTPSTLYNFQAKARNGANVETAFGATTSGTTAVAQTVDYAVVQFPKTTQNINEGGSLTVYTRAYEGGLTTNGGSQSNLFAWVGYSSTNDNPANSGWTWVQATFNVDAGNDDEYKATLTGLPIGTYYYAARFQIGTGAYVYGGSNGNWNNDNVRLNVNPIVVDFAVVQFPKTTQTITENGSLDVFTRVYEDGLTTNGGSQSNLFAWVGYSSNNDNPSSPGWTWVASTFNAEYGNDDEYKTTLTGLPIGTYYYAARFQIGSGLYVYGGSNGVWNNDSVQLNVTADVVDFCNIQFPTTGIITEGMSFEVFAQVFEPGVTPGAGQGTGITGEIGYSTTNSTPDNSWTWVTATYNPAVTNNNDEYFANIGTGLAPGTYYYASRFIKSGSSTYVYGGTNGSPWTTSGVLTVNAIQTPVATTATLVEETSFTAHWDAVPNATSYRLDVSTSPTFGTSNTGSKNEGFETSLPTSYSSSPVVTNLSSGAWTLTNVIRTNTFNSGSYAAQLKSSNDGIMISPSVGGMSTVTFYAKRNGTSGSSGIAVYKIVNSVETFVQNITLPPSTYNQYTININETSSVDVKFKIVNTGGNVANIDDVVINYSLNIPSFVTGFEDLNVGNVTSYPVTGLTSGTTYYYRARAVLNAVTSGNSNVIDVTTLGQTIWTAGANTTAWETPGNWSNGVPTSQTVAYINSASYYPEIISAAEVNRLMISSGTSVTVTSGYNLTVTDVINNAGTLNIQNNANLIQENDVDNTGAGITNVKRNSASIMRLDYTLWSSPVTGQGLYAFSPFTFANRFYIYDTASNVYSNAVGFNIQGLNANGVNGTDVNNVKFSPGTAYLIRTPWDFPTAPTNYSGSFSGIPNNGTFTHSMSLAGTEPSETKPGGYGYNAVGNPYPSALDVAKFIDGNSTNIDGTLWFWRKTNNPANAVSYSTITKAGMTITADLKNGATYSNPNVISVGQGFIVKANSTTLNYNNTMRSNLNVNQFFKESPKNRYWIELTDAKAVNYGQNLVAYIDGATLGYDNGFDGLFINDLKTTLLTLAGDKEVVIQARPEFNSQDVLPLVFKADVAGTYTINLAQVEGVFDNGQQIYLKDNFTSSLHNLNAGAYTFSSEVGNFINRFEILYQNSLAVSNPAFNENQVIVYKKNQELTINSGNVIMDNVKIYDMQGRLLYNKKNINASEIKINTVTTNQILLVKITSDNNEVVTKKVMN